MPSRILKPFSLVRALVLCATLLYTLGAAAAELAPQSSQAEGVGVNVKPTDVSANAATWKFQVTLTTHSGDLGDDLARSAILVDAAGKPQPALGWDGDPPGGHHRKGVLRFKALSPRPDTLELRIPRAGEAAPRKFSWKLN
ncbi:MAG: hypothetical protein A3F75_07695 [Betaproteobacteria bacterium RIFCSPLOWO2_12_FULL_64_23]|nr:MAG: hypothetical protein A3F75_07695 [Betaproteobacteria bacterium RIFCSPLOWO2_12_FULL_64_23]